MQIARKQLRAHQLRQKDVVTVFRNSFLPLDLMNEIKVKNLDSIYEFITISFYLLDANLQLITRNTII